MKYFLKKMKWRDNATTLKRCMIHEIGGAASKLKHILLYGKHFINMKENQKVKAI